ncbi:MAG: serine/threonine-protein kinase [Isosphaeraceae bacterium]
MRRDDESQPGRWDFDLESYLANHGADNVSTSVLTTLVKQDLARRFKLGQRPRAAEYLERFSVLGEDSDRVLSVVYEEFCLCEEFGFSADPEEFCRHYAPWTDSLASQLGYHRDLSQVAGLPYTPPKYPEPGEQFEQFALLEELGRGGDARVFRARERSLGDRQVVVKISSDRGSEANILGRLDHPNIVAVLSVVHQPQNRLRGLCMPYRPGISLDQLIRRINPAHSGPRKARSLLDAIGQRAAPPEPKTVVDPDAGLHRGAQLDEPTVVDPALEPLRWVPSGPAWADFPARGIYADGVAWVGRGLAKALDYAHSQGIEHRDVKPANVLLTFHQGPQLLDFNLAHDPSSAVEATAALRGGTLPYMAPEQLRAFLDPAQWAAVDARADLYSLGLVLREMLTGISPDVPEPGIPLTRAISGLLDRRSDLVAIPPAHRTHWFRSRTHESSAASATATTNEERLAAASSEAGAAADAEPRPVRVPSALATIVARCLHPDASRRYRTGAELAEDLDCYLKRLPLKHCPNPSRVERVKNWVTRHTLGVATTCLALSCTLAAFGWNFERLTQAPEERNVFVAAVESLERNDPERTLAMIAPLIQEAPHSPLLQFYRAAALARQRAGVEVTFALDLAWNQPDAGEILKHWAQTHPTLIAHASETGRYVLELQSSNGRLSRDVDSDRLQGAEKTLALAVELSPREEPARFALSALYERFGDYEKAQAQLSQLIDETWISPDTPERAFRLAEILLPLARIGAKRGSLLVDRGEKGEPVLGEASLVLNSALADLDRYDRLPPEQVARDRCRSHYIRCDALLSVGRLQELKKLPAEASRTYAEADQLIPSLEPCYRDLKEFELLRKQIERRRAALAKAGEAGAATTR